MVTKRRLVIATGLIDNGLQGVSQPAQDQATQVAADQACQRQRRDHFLSAGPQSLVAKATMADQGDRSQLRPAVGDLRLARFGTNRQAFHEPGRGALVALCSRAFDDQLAMRIVDADRLVMPAVEQRGDSQFQSDPIWILLAQRQRQRRGVVGILHAQLLLKVGAGG
jgi:hypothetical protein